MFVVFLGVRFLYVENTYKMVFIVLKVNYFLGIKPIYLDASVCAICWLFFTISVSIKKHTTHWLFTIQSGFKLNIFSFLDFLNITKHLSTIKKNLTHGKKNK